MNSHGITLGSRVRTKDVPIMEGTVIGVNNQQMNVQWDGYAEPITRYAHNLTLSDPRRAEMPSFHDPRRAEMPSFHDPRLAERSPHEDLMIDIPEIMYLTCQHGINTANTHSLYPIRTPFQSAVYYSPAAYQVLPEEPVRQLIQECKGNSVISTALQNGTFKALSRLIGSRPYLHVPPMLMKIEEADLHKPLFTALEGVWRVVFINNIVTSIVKIQTQRQWLATAFDNTTETLRTQSYILHALEKIVREQGDNPSDVSVGMLVCHDQTAYSGRIADLSGNRSYTNAAEEPVLLPKEALFSSSEQIIPTDQLSLALWSVPGFDPSTTSAWTALARQRIVGCGMNVLAYYGIIEESEARCRVSALPIQGQSIFSLYTMFHDIKITEPTKFVVVRVPLENSDEIFHELQQIPEDVVTFVKLYADTIRKGEDSHVGHTISFIKHKGIVYLVDPQASGNVPIGSGAALRYYTRYGDKEFIDMVFIERPIIVGNRTIYSVDEFRGRVGALRGRILSMNGLHWGGKRTRRVRRKKNKTRVK